MLAVLALSIPLVASTAPGPDGGDREHTVDVRTYSSPDARYTLVVDPSTRNGAGEARYRLSRDGVQVWVRDEPITLRDVVVGDDGFFAGYAYTHGFRDAGGRGRFVVALSAKGGLDLRVVLSESRATTDVQRAPWPRGCGVVFDPDTDHVIVRRAMRAEDRGEEWLVYDASKRQLERSTRPGVTSFSGSRWIFDVLHVARTPLNLVAWPDTTSSLAFGLVEDGGELVAVLEELHAPGDHAPWRPPDAMPSTHLLARGERRFAIDGSFGTREFALVAPTAASESWSCVELERRARAATFVSAEPIRVELELLADVELELTSASLDHEFVFDVEGRLFLQDAKTNAVHVLGPNGRELRTIGDGRRRTSRRTLFARPGGGVVVESADATAACLDADLVPRCGFALVPEPDDPVTPWPRPAAFVSDELAWFYRDHPPGLELRSSSGTVVRSLDRRTDGDWFRQCDVAFAPTRAFVVGDRRMGAARTLDGPVLCLYASDGTPQRTLVLDRPIHPNVFTGRWVVDVDTHSVVLFDTTTETWLRALIGRDLDQDLPRPRVFSSPNGRELWVVDTASARVRKYALPK